MGATMRCLFGLATSNLVVLPTSRVTTQELPDANINDFVPLVNILPFGVCVSPANPAVIAATAAAMGVLVPMPCIPVTTSPWAPGKPTILVGNFPALDNLSTLTCMWGGVIAFTTPGEVTVLEP